MKNIELGKRSDPLRRSDTLAWQRLSGLADWLLLTLLGLATILARWPFRVGMLSHFDSINYALALDHFDMRLAQPQAPGYPLYILLGRAYSFAQRLVAGEVDHPAALVGLSILSSGLAVAAIFLAGREMYGRRAGIFAALLTAASTVVWYMGEIAAPYTLDLFASAVVGWLCYRLLASSKPSLVWVTGAAVGLAGALRLQTLVFLFPLYLFALLGGLQGANRRSWKTIAGGAALAACVFGLFFIPAVLASGGPAAFLRSMRSILPIFRDADTLVRSARWVRFSYNLKTIASYTLRTLGELAVPAVLLGILAHRSPPNARRTSERNSAFGLRSDVRIRFWPSPRLVFLLFWLLPSWIVYFLIWPGNLGTILVSMPPLFLLAGAGLDWVASRGRWGQALGAAWLGVLLAWSILVFCVLPEAPFGRAYRTFNNYASLQDSMAYYQVKLSLVGRLPAESSVVFTDDFRHLQYYLPEYHTFTYPRFEEDQPEIVRQVISVENGRMDLWKNVDSAELLPPGTRRIVFFDSPGELRIVPGLQVELLSESGYAIKVITIPPGRSVSWTSEQLALQP